MPRLRSAVIAALLLGSAVPAAAQTTGSADAQLKALYGREWAWRQEQGLRGNRAGGDGVARFPSVDAKTQAARLAYWEKALAEFNTIPLDQLSPGERINAAVFRESISELASNARFKTYEAPFNSDTFFWSGLTPRQGGFANLTQYRNYIGRMRDIPRYFDEQIANMNAGLKRGYTVPKISATGRDVTIEPFTKADPSNPFYGPFADMPPTIPADEQAKLKAEADQVIKTAVVPAYLKLLDFMRNTYIPKARTTTAAEAQPNGKAFYAAQVRNHTTLELNAEQIHEIGLKEVARIGAEMEATKAQTGFKGSMPEFLTFLRTDPQFYPKTPHELLAFAAYVVKRVDGKIDQVVTVLPRRRFTILPVPAALAPIYTGGRGGLESCLFNTFDLPSRPLYTLTALAVHECNPGHSFQAAVATELTGFPDFRRQTGFTGYGEGWGLYTEWLGTKLGVYDTPYENFGRLSYEMWRACRLVIDTGIHHYGWSREKAQQYLRDHTALSEREITTEVDRYIAWPAQALAYKLGEMLIRRKRAEAEAKLGSGFDQRGFHDAILSIGSVPLPVLEARLDKFIADGGKNPPAAD